MASYLWIWCNIYIDIVHLGGNYEEAVDICRKYLSAYSEKENIEYCEENSIFFPHLICIIIYLLPPLDRRGKGVFA